MNKEFLYEMLDTMSVSGHEIGLQKKVIAEMTPYADEIRTDMTVNEIIKAYALLERALMYDWCLCSGDYSLSKYSAEMMGMFLKNYAADEK